MLKNILKINGAQELSRIEQKSINGGAASCATEGWCNDDQDCRIHGPCFKCIPDQSAPMPCSGICFWEYADPDCQA